jgi:hypothetical protein
MVDWGNLASELAPFLMRPQSSHLQNGDRGSSTLVGLYTRTWGHDSAQAPFGKGAVIMKDLETVRGRARCQEQLRTQEHAQGSSVTVPSPTPGLPLT